MGFALSFPNRNSYLPRSSAQRRGGKLNSDHIIDIQKDSALFGYVVEATVPLLADGPTVLGTGTLFTHEGRHFVVTAAHILKVDHNNPDSDDIDLTGIAVPNGRSRATIFTLGSFTVHRPAPPSRVDVAVLELLDADSIAKLKRGWSFLGFDAAGPFPTGARFISQGFRRPARRGTARTSVRIF